MNTLFIPINPEILENYLDIHVRLLCTSCKRYNISASCPPKIPDICYYNNLFKQYKYGILIIKKFIIDDIKNWKKLGKDSSEELRKEIIKFVDELKYENYTDYDYYGAGSCKHCNKCSYPCKFPDKQLIPLEGTGLNVVKLVKDMTNITLEFPVENYGFFYRIGLVFYEIK